MQHGQRTLTKSPIRAVLSSPSLLSRMFFFTANESNEDDGKYLKSYQLEGKGQGSKVTITTNTGHILETDIPKSMGGDNTAPQPVETLLAAWMGCTQATSIFVGRQMKPKRVLVEKLLFENIQAFRDERGALQLPLDNSSHKVPSRVQKVTGTIYIFAKSNRKNKEYLHLSNDELKILREQTELRCPVANMMIASGCAMDVEW
eukprot:CAMPEP_0194231168 /NCGR_PEP_ID=MMETSP0156-20130528/44788_1 /TAXON_ID=33649 /ORGANISM="Thalassionema nitzschioides, Strain L26-B" /LENGTH=202 /DNA_ID=CAMNT_0038963783 /DNA_START=74 /DNA_END=679 /DNA_ORIENTATION=+